jgi:hypothetical protein
MRHQSNSAKTALVCVSCIQNIQIRGETIAKVFGKVDTFWMFHYRQASKHQPSEVGSFSYWFDKPRFHTEGRLAAVLIIPFSWGSQLGA